MTNKAQFSTIDQMTIENLHGRSAEIIVTYVTMLRRFFRITIP